MAAPRRKAGPTKRVVTERMAMAMAEQSIVDMRTASYSSCDRAMGTAFFAAVEYGRASMRLGDTHPALREAGTEVLKAYDKLVKRCSR